MIPTLTMMSLTGRERLTEETLALVSERGGGYALPGVLFYFAPEGGHRELRVPGNWTVVNEVWHGQLPDFWRLIQRIPHDRDWIFLEDDIHPCTNAVLKMARVEVPEDIGLLSFFDMRNEFPRPGIWRNTPGQSLWGSQAIKLPTRIIPVLKQYSIEKRPFLPGWDTWIGMAVEHAGYRVAHYAPSLIQHVGKISVAYPSNGSGRPITLNFPGEDFDALGECSDPIVMGPWTNGEWRPEWDKKWCELHASIHPEGVYCPKFLKPRVTG